MPFLGTLQADLIYEHWTDLKTPNSIDSIHINLIRSNQLRLDIYLIPFYIYTSHRSAYKNRKNYMLRIFSVSLVINRFNFSFFFSLLWIAYFLSVLMFFLVYSMNNYCEIKNTEKKWRNQFYFRFNSFISLQVVFSIEFISILRNKIICFCNS